MGCHAITTIKDLDGQHLVSIFRHWDGNPSNHGMQIAEFLANRPIKSGQPPRHPETGYPKMSNGISDLAAQLIHHLKSDPHSEVGNIHIMNRAEAADHPYIDYYYTITGKVGDDEAHIAASGKDGFQFSGSMTGFIEYIREVEEEDMIDEACAEGVKEAKEAWKELAKEKRLAKENR